jgi:SAM-dependent methyltransferase
MRYTHGAPTVDGMSEHQHGPDHGHDGDYTEMLDLDGSVLSGYWDEVTAWVADAGPTGPVRRVVDLGSGAGTATYAFGQRFPDAELVAVDVSGVMLSRLEAGARERGLAGRLRPVRADLDDAFPDLSGVDLAWASMSLHHMADPDRVLRELVTALSPGGVVAVAEFAEPLRFLPDEVGDGLEQRLLAALSDANAQMVAHMASDWSARVAAVGLSVVARRGFEVDLADPLPAGAGRYARLWFERLFEGVDDRLGAGDRTKLECLVHGTGADALENRNDLHLRGVRTVTLARLEGDGR